LIVGISYVGLTSLFFVSVDVAVVVDVHVLVGVDGFS
jgi:hypothetical protein